MEQEKINSLIIENMKKIFSFCLTRVNNTAEAEDLAGDIFVELLRSYKNIRDNNNFYGFMWGVANNVYKRYLRKTRQKTVSFEECYMGNLFDTPESIYTDKEEIFVLRNELSILSKEYREVTVLYYIKNKSCSEISDILKISIEMVKYYLFRARKIMKEGMFMSRELGEKSYIPDVFKMDYWGTGPNDEYFKLFERRLPGNILLAAYYEPLTVTELSLELGVSAPYLEDELTILLSYDLIRLMGNGRYQTNIIIFTTEYENEVYKKNKEIYSQTAESLYKFLKENETKIREIDFYGHKWSKNRLYWSVANLALLHSFHLVDKVEGFPLLSNGSQGYVYGFNRDYSTHKYNGIDNADTINIHPPMFTIVNYKILNNMLSWEHHHRYRNTIIDVMTNKSVTELEVVNELIRSGFIISENENLRINFPVYTVSQYKKLLDILSPITSEIKEIMTKENKISAKILISHSPKALKDKCEPLTVATSGMNVMANIIESMYEQNFLIIPKQNEIVSTYGIVEDTLC